MKKLVYIFLVFMALSATVGCSRSVDKRLVLADTLMWKSPDSSLAILNAINRDSLHGDENQAYYALLLTQAKIHDKVRWPYYSDLSSSASSKYLTNIRKKVAWLRTQWGGVTGDVNLDGAINAADVTTIYTYLLTGDLTNLDPLDVNGDGSINSADITTLYDILLGNKK